MAERRMFSKVIVNSARFLRMPQTTRLLYYDLGMAADDDGVVEAFTVIRMSGAAEEDLRVLAARGFIVILNEDLVSYITDWSANNQIRKDRKRPSAYSELLVKVLDGYTVDNQTSVTCQPNGNQTATEVSIGEVSREENKSLPPMTDADFIQFWTAYPRKVGKAAARKAFHRVSVSLDTLLSAIEKQKSSAQWNRDSGQYIPNPATWLNQGRWEDEIAAYQGNQPNSIPAENEYGEAWP